MAKQKATKTRKIPVLAAPVDPLTDGEITAVRAMLSTIGNAPAGSLFSCEDGVLVAFAGPTVKSALSPGGNGNPPYCDPI